MKSSDLRSSTRLAGLIKRYHEWPVSRTQTNAEHTWHLATIYLAVFGVPRAEVLVYILYHDVGELGVGDSPFPVKANNPILKAEVSRLENESLRRQGIQLPELTPEEKLQVKNCDLLEMYSFGLEEVTRGNKFGAPIMEDTWQQICAMLKGMPDAQMQVRGYIRRYDAWQTP